MNLLLFLAVATLVGIGYFFLKDKKEDSSETPTAPMRPIPGEPEVDPSGPKNEEQLRKTYMALKRAELAQVLNGMDPKLETTNLTKAKMVDHIIERL